ncbi:MAG: DUF4282 domain-containing protein [Planctomycetaceae bacterium]|nr:DUF4282 domain-containing protein [Planctomycetaceae bacterium]
MNYFYFDANGQRQGPVGISEIQSLITRKIITPTTPLETDTGDSGFAGQIPSLVFPNAVKFTNKQTGFLWLFDISDFFVFTRFLTNLIIPFIWVVGILVHIFVGLLFLVGMSYGLRENPLDALLCFLVGFVVLTSGGFFSLPSLRMALETIMVLFRIETHLRTIREKYEKT